MTLTFENLAQPSEEFTCRVCFLVLNRKIFQSSLDIPTCKECAGE